MTAYVSDIQVESHAVLNAHALPSKNVTATTNGSVTLVHGDPTSLVVSGTGTNFTVILSDATLHHQGFIQNIYNTTGNVLTIKDGAGNILALLSQQSVAYVYLNIAGTIAGEWILWQVLLSSVASGIISYNITSSTPFTTSSATDVIITGLTLTPQAGTYAVWFNADASCTQNNSNVVHSIYRNSIVIADSIRTTQSVSANFIFQESTQTIAQFNGTQACDARVRTNQGSLTVNGRSLLLIRLGT